ncbi:UBC core domain-containing protein [Caenorhabditis elegans]|uniref:UBC core domain-containing protein n=1 Tax=Caenorhabditis elegans TaxID=6239 RepID=Q20872_CAEEL|nr:UBC core domain-containing protein [Caenorhabditis elegans]CCD63136.1 UBC core domain-containing protein [Caenorhabditis elegans]|eukprot:NP_498198.1 Ubiquitin E2 (conjugating enzyme) variant [Caenorhabditis elegans]
MRRRSNRQYVDLSYFRETADALLFDVETNSREFTNEINTVKEEKAKWDERTPQGYTAKPISFEGADIWCSWICTVPGPRGSPWEGGEYEVSVNFHKWPIIPPICEFKTPLHHPNVDLRGSIYLKMLEQEHWSSETSLKKLLREISNLLATPDLTQAANIEAWMEYENQRENYEAKARAYAWTVNPNAVGYMEVSENSGIQRETAKAKLAVQNGAMESDEDDDDLPIDIEN